MKGINLIIQGHSNYYSVYVFLVALKDNSNRNILLLTSNVSNTVTKGTFPKWINSAAITVQV